MTAKLVYINSRETTLQAYFEPNVDYPESLEIPQSGDTLAKFIRPSYAPHEKYAADLRGTLWERLAEGAKRPLDEHRVHVAGVRLDVEHAAWKRTTRRLAQGLEHDYPAVGNEGQSLRGVIKSRVRVK